MGKLFAVVLAILRWYQPNHCGARMVDAGRVYQPSSRIDKQLDETMLATGVLFLSSN